MEGARDDHHIALRRGRVRRSQQRRLPGRRERDPEREALLRVGISAFSGELQNKYDLGEIHEAEEANDIILYNLFIPIFVVGMPTMVCVWNMERGAFCGMLLQSTAPGAVRKGSEAKWFSFPPFSKVGAAPESRTAQPGEIHHPSQVCGTVASSLGFLS